MPKKKGKKDEKGKKKKVDEAALEEKRAKENDLMKTMYEQARDRDRILQLEEENKQIKERAKEIEERLEKQLQKKQDVIWFLNRDIKQKETDVETLQEQVTNLQRNLERQEEEAKAMLKAAESTADHTISKLENKILKLEERQHTVNTFIQQKEALEAERDRLREQLEREKLLHKEHVDDLDREYLQQKENLKKDMLRKVRETKLSLLAMTEDQLHTTTKRTIMENDQMTTELQYQSKITEKLIEQNNKLMEENKEMRRELDLQADSERLLATRTNFFQKLIKKLNDKLRDAELVQQRNADEIAHVEREAKQQINAKEHEVQSLRQRVDELEQLLLQQSVNSKRAHEQVEKERERREQFLSLQDEAITFVLTCLQDVKREVLQASTGARTRHKEQSLDMLSLEERDRVLRNLLVKLSAQPHVTKGVPPAETKTNGFLPKIH